MLRDSCVLLGSWLEVDFCWNKQPSFSSGSAILLMKKRSTNMCIISFIPEYSFFRVTTITVYICAVYESLYLLRSYINFILYLQHTHRAFIAQSSNTERDQHAMTTPSDAVVLKCHASVGGQRQLLPSAIKVLSRSSHFPSESYLTVLSCFEQRYFYFGKRVLLLPFSPNSLRATPPDRISARWLMSVLQRSLTFWMILAWIQKWMSRAWRAVMMNWI